MILGLIIVIIAGMGSIYLRHNYSKACTTEAKLCPDGSSVARVPPACEFAPCPTVSADQQIIDKFADKTLAHTPGIVVTIIAKCTYRGRAVYELQNDNIGIADAAWPIVDSDGQLMFTCGGLPLPPGAIDWEAQKCKELESCRSIWNK